ncbi:unnamed protein product, partial [Vitis vinifera]
MCLEMPRAWQLGRHLMLTYVTKMGNWLVHGVETWHAYWRSQTVGQCCVRMRSIWLIRCCLGCEVFPYGSVPLKIYLLDGDIDLTVLCSSNVEEALASDVHAVLKGERQNENAEFEVKNVQFNIIVEVKPVKCLVKDIVIDISFNQLGGLSTLCFLKQVDRLIGKDHLFKRSIILIKSRCYYESRILGAYHGLISTYALEILVLYIFHLFHSSLDGPLAVGYRFLDYFSKFDWDNYCISLNGSVCKSSLPDIVAELPENGGFKYGSHKLGQNLLLPREVIQDELKNFFASTLERHRSKYMAEIQNFALTFGSRGSLEILLDLNGDYDSHIRSLQYGQCCYGHALPPPLLPSPPLSPSQLQINTPWDKVHQHLQFKRNLYSQMDSNGVILGNHFPVKQPA